MKRFLLLPALALTMVSCHQNPFFQEWDTPYGIPPYDQIRTSDYIPALKEGISRHNAEIEAIVNNPDTPDFENTIAPLELSGELLNKVQGVLFNVSETDRSDELDAVVEEALPLLSDHESDISFNKALYERVAAVYHADQSSLTREQQVVLKNHFDAFEREGIGLPQEKQDELREINSLISQKTQKIGNNILAESNAFKEKFGFSVSEYWDRMTTTDDEDLRRQYFEAYSMRGHNGNEHDNCALILEVMELRIRKAAILGYDTPANYFLSNKMAGNSETVDKFLSGIKDAALIKAKEEIKDMEAIAGRPIQPWDWWYYADKVRQQKYALDDALVRPYFHIDNVVKGLFDAAKTLYGVNAELLENVPSYNPECVKTYKLSYDDGSLIGILTTDWHPRASKRGGAWMNNVRNQYYDAEGNNVRPIIVNVGNLPEYLSADDVQTTFHEFGHALHGLLAQSHYQSVSGTSVKRDFVEMFSQFNENWAFQPELLARYAVNAEGQVIPQELVSKIISALKFNQGFMTTELTAASILDMKWHELSAIPAEAYDDPSAWIDGFETAVCDEMGLISQIIPRYRTTYFNHIFSSGYCAGYYGYLWAEVLDKDAFSLFEASPNGVWNLELAKKFKETFLEKGGSEEPMVLYKEFMGREPDSDAMLRARGLK